VSQAEDGGEGQKLHNRNRVGRKLKPVKVRQEGARCRLLAKTKIRSSWGRAIFTCRNVKKRHKEDGAVSSKGSVFRRKKIMCRGRPKAGKRRSTLLRKDLSLLTGKLKANRKGEQSGAENRRRGGKGREIDVLEGRDVSFNYKCSSSTRP